MRNRNLVDRCRCSWVHFRSKSCLPEFLQPSNGGDIMRTMIFQPWARSLSLKLLCFALILKSFFTVFWWLLTVKVTKSLLILFCRLNGNVIAKFLNFSLIIYLKLFISNSFSHLTGNNQKRYTHLCVCVCVNPNMCWKFSFTQVKLELS